jgi:hypothetical protein
MGAKPKIRVSYDHDAQYLLRLKQAIESDHSRPLSWRQEVISQLQELIEAFIQAPNPAVAEKKAANQ